MRRISIVLGGIFLVLWVGLVAYSSDGFSNMYPRQWLFFLGVPVAIYLVILAATRILLWVIHGFQSSAKDSRALNSTPRRKRLFKWVLAAFVILFLFPPFQFRLGGQTYNLGYSFLFAPPKFDNGAFGSVNLGLLLVEWIGLAVVAYVIWIYLGDRE